MSHIPSAAMPHAGPTHHDGSVAPEKPIPASGDRMTSGDRMSGWPLAAIIGGALALGAVAVAVPLLRTPAGPPPKRSKPKSKRKTHR